ncbi:MAG TPA: hypothetical protein VM510_06265, partial [Caulifigura sp.]|nr:hypothetical protein [Caulifigura sp.]
MAAGDDIRGSRRTRRVVFLAFPGVVLLDLIGPWDVFFLANQLAGSELPPYELELVSGDDSAAVPSCGGISMASHRTARNCRGAIDTLIVPADGINVESRPSV